jgi:hypothetical protein
MSIDCGSDLDIIDRYAGLRRPDARRRDSEVSKAYQGPAPDEDSSAASRRPAQEDDRFWSISALGAGVTGDPVDGCRREDALADKKSFAFGFDDA